MPQECYCHKSIISQEYYCYNSIISQEHYCHIGIISQEYYCYKIFIVTIKLLLKKEYYFTRVWLSQEYDYQLILLSQELSCPDSMIVTRVQFIVLDKVMAFLPLCCTFMTFLTFILWEWQKRCSKNIKFVFCLFLLVFLCMGLLFILEKYTILWVNKIIKQINHFWDIHHIQICQYFQEFQCLETPDTAASFTEWQITGYINLVLFNYVC